MPRGRGEDDCLMADDDHHERAPSAQPPPSVGARIAALDERLVALTGDGDAATRSCSCSSSLMLLLDLLGRAAGEVQQLAERLAELEEA